MNAVDPRFVMPIFDGAFAGGRRLPRHGDVACRSRTRSAVRADRGEARRRAVRAGRPSGRRPAGWRWCGIGVEPGLSDVFARYAADHLFSEIDELGVRDGANLDRRGLRLRAVVLDLDDDRGVPQPAGDLGEGPRLVHHRAVQRAGGLRLPRGHRAGRVRQRRARGGAADAALGRGASGSTFKYGLGEEFIDVLKTLHKLGLDRTEQGAGRRRRGVSPRDVVAACLPDPATLGDRMRGKTCAGPVGHRHRQGRPAARRRTSTTWSTTSGRCASTATSASSGRPRSTRWSRSSCWRTATWSGAGVLGPGGVRRRPVPRPAHRVRLALGPAGPVAPPTTAGRACRDPVARGLGVQFDIQPKRPARGGVCSAARDAWGSEAGERGPRGAADTVFGRAGHARAERAPQAQRSSAVTTITPRGGVARRLGSGP